MTYLIKWLFLAILFTITYVYSEQLGEQLEQKKRQEQHQHYDYDIDCMCGG